MRNYFIYFILILFIASYFPVYSQQLDPIQVEQAIAELNKRGVSEEEFRAKMKEKGIELESLTQEELIALQPMIEEVVAEIQAEKQSVDAAEAVDNAVSTSAIEEKPLDMETDVVEEIPAKEKTALPPAKIYGQDIFRSNQLKVYQNVEGVKAPDSYQLGVGDKVFISIWGISQGDFSFEIDKSGFIAPTGMQKIYLKGISFGKAKKLLQKRFSQAYVFQPEQFSVDISSARTITVNIFGEVFQYGSFTISAMNTAFNALVAAGGPTDIGSLRNIRIMRGDETKYLDVYEFLNDPTVQFDFFLENNDLIYVPVAEKLIQVSGAIKRPMTYELKTGENLKDVIAFAGGFQPNAYQENIQIKRISNDQEVLIDVDYIQSPSFALQAGDQVMIKTIPARLQNAVSIQGAVEYPGEFALEKGMKLKDLVDKGQPIVESRKDVAILVRTNEDGTKDLRKVDLQKVVEYPDAIENLLLQRNDVLRIFSQAEFADKGTFAVRGAVRQPVDEAPINPQNPPTIEEAILLAGGLLPSATDFAYLYRKDFTNPDNQSYVKIDIKAIMANPTSSENILLSPNDVLEVPALTNYTDAAVVNISGAVRQPGEYAYGEGLYLKDLLTLAGGLKMEAASNRIDIYRIEFVGDEATRTIAESLAIDENLNLVSGDTYQLQPYDQVVIREIPSFEFQQVIRINGEVQYPGNYALEGKEVHLYDIIQKSGGLTREAYSAGAILHRVEDETGLVIIRLDEVMDNPSSPYNILLKNGDLIDIPQNNDLVKIRLSGTYGFKALSPKIAGSGQISVPYATGKKANWYIKEYAEGIHEQKDKRSYVVVENPNGEVDRSKNYGFFRTFPKPKKGGIIWVGYDEIPQKEKKKEREPVDWESITSKTLAQVSAVLTVFVLVRSLQ